MRRALVTGGSAEIGAAICRRLAGEGFHVAVHANTRQERAAEVSAEIRNGGGSAETTTFDVTDIDATAREVAALLEDGPIQVIVNGVGIYDDAPLAGMREDQWKRVIDVSLHGFFHVTQPLLLPMIRTRWGRIVNLTSVAGILGNRGQANYAAAKTGLHGATKSLALELASRGITVNAVAPGIIAGRTTDKEFDQETIKRLVPMKRAGTPEEVAALTAFLASDDAGYITGQIISINGAMA